MSSDTVYPEHIGHIYIEDVYIFTQKIKAFLSGQKGFWLENIFGKVFLNVFK